jgi:hypothetical protein
MNQKFYTRIISELIPSSEVLLEKLMVVLLLNVFHLVTDDYVLVV